VPNKELFYWLTIPFNRYPKIHYYIIKLFVNIQLLIIILRVDYERIKSIGPDRACAEWLLKNGASVRWKGFSEYLKDYDKLQSDQTQYYIQAIDGTDSGITHVGFPYLG